VNFIIFDISLNMPKRTRATVEVIDSVIPLYNKYKRRHKAKFAINAGLVALDRMSSDEREILVDQLLLEESIRSTDPLAESVVSEAQGTSGGKKQNRPSRTLKSS
jgi:hypothetical protein